MKAPTSESRIFSHADLQTDGHDDGNESRLTNLLNAPKQENGHRYMKSVILSE